MRHILELLGTVDMNELICFVSTKGTTLPRNIIKTRAAGKNKQGKRTRTKKKKRGEKKGGERRSSQEGNINNKVRYL